MHGIIFVCDICFDELKVSQLDFDPFDIEKMKEHANAKGWVIPELIGHHEGNGIDYEITASSIKSICARCARGCLYCPKCKRELIKKNNKMGESVKYCNFCNSSWFILKTS